MKIIKFGNVASTATEKAESFASFFANNDTVDDKGLLLYVPQTNLMSKIIFKSQVIKKLKSDSAAGPETSHPFSSKNAPEAGK